MRDEKIKVLAFSDSEIFKGHDFSYKMRRHSEILKCIENPASWWSLQVLVYIHFKFDETRLKESQIHALDYKNFDHHCKKLSHKRPLIIIGAPIKVAYWLGKSESRILNIRGDFISPNGLAGQQYYQIIPKLDWNWIFGLIFGLLWNSYLRPQFRPNYCRHFTNLCKLGHINGP